MFSKELEDLIQATLEDGILEENEKAALVKRAQREDVDLGELEIYINSLLQKRQRELNKESREARAKQEEAELQSERLHSKTLRKCPKCGEYIPNLTNVCPGCGFIIENSKTDETVLELMSLLNQYHDLMFCSDDGKVCFPAMRAKISNKLYEAHPDYFYKHPLYESTEPIFEKIKVEAALYRDNEEMKSLLNKVRNKEAHLLYEEALKGNKTAFSNLKTHYSDIVSQQFPDFEKKINTSKTVNRLKGIVPLCLAAAIMYFGGTSNVWLSFAIFFLVIYGVYNLLRNFVHS